MRSGLLLVVLISAALAAGIGTPRAQHITASSSGRTARSRDRATAPLSTVRPHARSIHVPGGATTRRFQINEPDGVIQLLRITVPRGTRATLTGAIPRFAGVGIRTPQSNPPWEACRRRGRVEICTQPEEACPMPPARWQFRLRKTAGPAGEVRVEFIVGHQPTRKSR